MEYDFTSTTFSPKFDYAHLFSVSVHVPSEVKTVDCEVGRCEKCNSFLLPDENICPICQPANFLAVKNTTKYKSFRLRSPYDFAPGPANLIILDLDLPLNELLAFSSLLISEAKKPDSLEFNGNVFYFAFLGYQIAFLNYSEKKIRFSFIPSIPDFHSFAKPLVIFEDFLGKAIELAKSFMKPAEDKRTPLQELLQFLDKNESFNDLQDIFYIFYKKLPKDIQYPFGSRFHLIKSSVRSSKTCIDFAYRFRSTFFSVPRMGPAIIMHIKKCLAKEIVSNPCFTITASNGIDFREFGGPIKNIEGIEGITKTINLHSGSSQPTPIATASSRKSEYNKEKCFSFQIVIQYFCDYAYVVNEVFPKATNSGEWVNSMNRDFLLYVILLRQAHFLLKCYITTRPPWKEYTKLFRIPRECKQLSVYYDLISKFFDVLFRPTKMFLTDSQKTFILFLFCYGAIEDSVYLIKSFIDNEFDTTNYVLIPPFILIHEQCPIENVEDKIRFSFPMIFPIAERKYSIIRTLVDSFRNELNASLRK